MPISRIALNNFTTFGRLDFRPSDGLNVLIGANGTGKTHLMKVAYAACAISQTRPLLSATSLTLVDKLVALFLPSGRRHGRLVTRRQGVDVCQIRVESGEHILKTEFTTRQSDHVRASGERDWQRQSLHSAYIPVKEILANAPGFLSLYDHREIHFDETYRDILSRAFFPVERGPMPTERGRLLRILGQAIDGRVVSQNEEFFLKNRSGRLEFSLLAEGYRKLGLLWLLIRNGTLLRGSVLFWDEPEANLNPALYGPIVKVLLELQRSGVQIFLATHDYVILKEIDLQMKATDAVQFHSLYREESGAILLDSATVMGAIEHNMIMQTFSDLYDREIERSLRPDT